MEDISNDFDNELFNKCSLTTTTVDDTTSTVFTTTEATDVSCAVEMVTSCSLTNSTVTDTAVVNTEYAAAATTHVDLNKLILEMPNTELTYLIGITMNELEKRRAKLFLPPPPRSKHLHHCAQPQSQLKLLQQVTNLLPPPPPTQQSQLQSLPLEHHDSNKTNRRAISEMHGHLSRGMLYLDGKDTRACWRGPPERLKQHFHCVCGRGAFACPDCKTHEQTWDSFVIRHYGATVFRGKRKKILCPTFS